jgi:hypothetical protein
MHNIREDNGTDQAFRSGLATSTGIASWVSNRVELLRTGHRVVVLMGIILVRLESQNTDC